MIGGWSVVKMASLKRKRASVLRKTPKEPNSCESKGSEKNYPRYRTVDDMMAMGKFNLPRLSDSDPGLAIEFNRQGLLDHRIAGNPSFHSEAAVKATIVEALTGAHNPMVPADDGEGGQSDCFFTGTMAQFLGAQAALHALPEVHHQEGKQDVGRAYAVTPKGASNVRFDFWNGDLNV